MTRLEELENLITECCKASSIFYQGKRQAVKYLCGQGTIVFFESSRMIDLCEVNIPNYDAETDEPLIMQLIRESEIFDGCESHEYNGCHYCYTIMLKEGDQ